jgi:hypothetical protein
MIGTIAVSIPKIEGGKRESLNGPSVLGEDLNLLKIN